MRLRNLFMKQKQVHRLTGQTCGCRGWSGRGMDWEFGVSGCERSYIVWINNKVLLYDTGNYIHYPVINHNGKKNERERIYFN